jgi:hypothetical protein
MGNCSTNLDDDERLVVSPRRAKYMLDCGNTRLYELLGAHEIESYLDGRSRKVVVASIKAYIVRRLAESAPTKISAPAPRKGDLGEPKRKGHQMQDPVPETLSEPRK